MGKGIQRAAMAVALSAFLFSIAEVGSILYRYYRDGKLYRDAEDKFTDISETVAWEDGKEAQKKGEEEFPQAEGTCVETENPPFIVDFAALEQVNKDVVGWLYCEDTPISYPIVRGEDNSFYLKHGYDKKASSSGTIFVDVACSTDFSDFNTILYGHHMKNGSMFACLEKWADQEFYEKHPQMWLMTPEGNYRIVLFAGYVTQAVSESYTIFIGPGPELEEYLASCAEKSDFQADVDFREESDARYVVMSTCEYSFQNARYVLHGRLVPVFSPLL